MPSFNAVAVRAYGAMPNGNFHRPEYELVMIGNDLDDDSKADANEKRKLRARYPFQAAIVKGDDDSCEYRISDNGVQSSLDKSPLLT